MEIQLGEASKLYGDEREGFPDNLLVQPKPGGVIQDSIISIPPQKEGQPHALRARNEPGAPENILVRILVCIKHICCCCCFRRVSPPREDINTLDVDGTTPVFRALKKSNLKEVYKLIEQGSNLTLSKEQDSGATFFHLATYFPELIKYLIESGKMDNIDINDFVDNQESTPIGYAILLSHEVDDKQISSELMCSAKMLLDWKGRLDRLISLENKYVAFTILHFMIAKKIEIVWKRERDDLNSLLGMGISPLGYALYLMWTKSAKGENSDIYLKNANHLVKVNAKIIYTDPCVLENNQDQFRQFVIQQGFESSLAEPPAEIPL